MSMQVCCVENQPVRPLSDVEKMKMELEKIKKFVLKIYDGKADEAVYKDLKDSIYVTNEIVHALDNANDFFKIGGFPLLLPLLECPDTEVVASTAELIADLCQNNTYCQEKAMEYNLLPKLMNLVKESKDLTVCVKALYALSCLCRHNKSAVKALEESNGPTLLLETIRRPDEKLRTKTAFFLSHLSSSESFIESLYIADFVGTLINLLQKDEDSASEHLLSALLLQISRHEKSKLQCQKEVYKFGDILEQKLKLYGEKGEYREAKGYCEEILKLLSS